MSALGLRLTPHGHLVVEDAADALAMDQATTARIGKAFAQGTGHGLLQLGAGEVGRVLPPAFGWWREFSARYVASVCLQSSGTRRRSVRRAGCRDTAGGRAGHAGADGAHYGGGGIPDAGGSAGGVDRDGRGALCLACCRQDRLAELSEGSEPGLEPGRTGAFQSGGKPQGP